MPSGSYVVISHLVDPSDGAGDDQAIAQLRDIVSSGSLKGVIGLGRAAEIVPLTDRWPDGPMLQPPNVAQRIMVGGVARKP